MRLSKRKIKHNLKQLNILYNQEMSSHSANASLHMTFYSKLALIEYCGWLEVTIDILIRRIVSRINDTQLIKVGEESIKSNYGFSYQRHFRDLLIRSLGLQKTEKLLSRLRHSGDLVILESKLNTFKNLRNEAAHNYFDGVGSYNSPNFYIIEVDNIFPIFQKIQKYL